MPKDLWYPISQIAEILEKDYVDVASALEIAGVVRVDSASGFPCAPATYLKSIPAFAKWLRSRHPSDLAPVSNRSLPTLDICADMMSKRDIKRHYKTFFGGEIETPDAIDLMLHYGQWRFRQPTKATMYYRLGDFIDHYTWASPAELSFQNAGAHLLAMQKEQRRRAENKPLPTMTPEEEAKEAEHDEELFGDLAPPPVPEEMDWLKNSHTAASQPLDLATDAPKPKPLPELEGYVKFKFYQRIKQPPASAHADYLDWVPGGLLYAAGARAFEWAGLLEEQRTGKRRAIEEGYTDTKFKEDFARVERSIYRERRAWTHGFLTPIMPPNFSFLF